MIEVTKVQDTTTVVEDVTDERQDSKEWHKWEG